MALLLGNGHNYRPPDAASLCIALHGLIFAIVIRGCLLILDALITFGSVVFATRILIFIHIITRIFFIVHSICGVGTRLLIHIHLIECIVVEKTQMKSR